MNIQEKNDNIYESIISYCQKNFGENGHKHATELTKLALRGILSPALKRTIQHVTNEPKKTHEVAYDCDVDIAAACNALHVLENLGLVFNVGQGKLKRWVLM